MIKQDSANTPIFLGPQPVHMYIVAHITQRGGNMSVPQSRLAARECLDHLGLTRVYRRADPGTQVEVGSVEPWEHGDVQAYLLGGGPDRCISRESVDEDVQSAVSGIAVCPRAEPNSESETSHHSPILQKIVPPAGSPRPTVTFRQVSLLFSY